MKTSERHTQLAVVGAGPGGYPAAFHAADLGMKVVLIDRDENPGGVCLYRGCIPSKALLHAAQLIQHAREAAAIGIRFPDPEVDFARIRAWRDEVVGKLTGGLGQLTRQRGIDFIQGTAQFRDGTSLAVAGPDGEETVVHFEHAILATGSVPAIPRFVPESPRIMDSTAALEIAEIPRRLLVLGGGYIGLELGQVYAAFGSEVSVVEMQASLLPQVDPDLVKPLASCLKREFKQILLNTRVAAMRDTGAAVEVDFESESDGKTSQTYDRVLVAVGRRPVTAGLGLETTRVETDDQGFVKVDEHRRTAEPAIYAIGDIAGQPMLAHKATHEGRSAVEAIHGGKAVYNPRAIPAVVFTDPEIAWAGASEDEARRQGFDVRVGAFPWQASGRAATLDRAEGLTKIVADAADGRILGVGIAGPGAGELIGEGVLAIEMGAVAEDLALTIHAHPSLSETIMEAAERILGQSTHFFQRM
ncbi:MAG: dihydrolipoyl dehydrogenase [Lentisphaeria bacterium]|jgi:dihydrolipoamide dehydrogenase|nr:dihydrolipoyl dehydrogenase [Lentisphaeria bacterium]